MMAFALSPSNYSSFVERGTPPHQQQQQQQQQMQRPTNPFAPTTPVMASGSYQQTMFLQTQVFALQQSQQMSPSYYGNNGNGSNNGGNNGLYNYPTDQSSLYTPPEGGGQFIHNSNNNNYYNNNSYSARRCSVNNAASRNTHTHTHAGAAATRNRGVTEGGVGEKATPLSPPMFPRREVEEKKGGDGEKSLLAFKLDRGAGAGAEQQDDATND